MFRGSRDFNILTCILLFVSVITLSGFRTNISFWRGASVVSPTGLSLAHSANNKTFSVSWTAGSGNGGASGCRLEYQRTSDGAWVSLGTVNCDVSGSSVGTVSLPGDGWNGGGSWSSTPIRLFRISNSTAIGNLGNVACSARASSSSSTPSIDEDCNNNWDDSGQSTYTVAGCGGPQCVAYRWYGNSSCTGTIYTDQRRCYYTHVSSAGAYQCTLYGAWSNPSTLWTYEYPTSDSECSRSVTGTVYN